MTSNPTPTISSSLQPRLPIEQRIEDWEVKKSYLRYYLDNVDIKEWKYIFHPNQLHLRNYKLFLHATEYLAEYKADYVYKLMSEQEYSEKAAQVCAYLELGY